MSDFNYSAARISAAQICRAAGIERSVPSALEVITDIMLQHLQLMSKQAVFAAENRGDEFVDLNDVLLAARECNVLHDKADFWDPDVGNIVDVLEMLRWLQGPDQLRQSIVARPKGSMQMPAMPQGVGVQGVPPGMPQGVPQGVPQGMPIMPPSIAQGMPMMPQGMPPGMPPGMPQGMPPMPPGMPPMPHGMPPMPPMPPGMPQGMPLMPQSIAQSMPMMPAEFMAVPVVPDDIKEEVNLEVDINEAAAAKPQTEEASKETTTSETTTTDKTTTDQTENKQTDDENKQTDNENKQTEDTKESKEEPPNETKNNEQPSEPPVIPSLPPLPQMPTMTMPPLQMPTMPPHEEVEKDWLKAAFNRQVLMGHRDWFTNTPLGPKTEPDPVIYGK